MKTSMASPPAALDAGSRRRPYHQSIQTSSLHIPSYLCMHYLPHHDNLNTTTANNLRNINHVNKICNDENNNNNNNNNANDNNRNNNANDNNRNNNIINNNSNNTDRPRLAVKRKSPLLACHPTLHQLLYLCLLALSVCTSTASYQIHLRPHSAHQYPTSIHFYHQCKLDRPGEIQLASLPSSVPTRCNAAPSPNSQLGSRSNNCLQTLPHPEAHLTSLHKPSLPPPVSLILPLTLHPSFHRLPQLNE